MPSIPVLDLHSFRAGSPEDKQKFVSDLGNAFEQIGFVAIKNHGFSEQAMAQLYQAVQHFFSLSDQVKQKYEIPGLHGQRGYTGKGKEHAKDRAAGDLKEFYHVGQENIPDQADPDQYPANIWPEEVPEFRETTLHAYATLEKAGVSVLQAIALHLGLEQHYFDEKVQGGNSILRPIHYFPIVADQVPPEAVRAAAHGDINLITLLMGASAEGLEILLPDGSWLPVQAGPSQLVVNVGDMLSRLTNDKLKSTIHRVVNPPKEQWHSSRYSIPFFMHPRGEVDLSCLPGCIDKQHPRRYQDITAGAFLNQRLAEIGLKT